MYEAVFVVFLVAAILLATNYRKAWAEYVLRFFAVVAAGSAVVQVMNSWEIAAYGVEVAANGNLELGALNGQAATFAAVQAVVFAVLAVAAAILSSRTGERM